MKFTSCILFFIFFVIATLSPKFLCAQKVLEATIGTNAYTVIDAAFGGTAEETPDQTNGSHTSFTARHIQMVYDATLGKYVFRFLIHINSVQDNDIATLESNRQRVEMKTYAASPDSLKFIKGETAILTWYFKLPTGFQPSQNFTHIHQIKQVNGDDSDPIFTISPYYNSSGNLLKVLYVADSTASAITLTSAPLPIGLKS